MNQEIKDYYDKYYNYDEITGKLTWKKLPKYSRASIGDEVGSIDAEGYRRLNMNKYRKLAHRVIWYCEKGYEPKYLDHINGIKDDNRLCNLRDVSHQDNCRNHSKSKANTSGITGVNFHIGKQKWCASIGVNRKHINLGTFECKEDAIKARKQAEQDYGFHENHGR